MNIAVLLYSLIYYYVPKNYGKPCIRLSYQRERGDEKGCSGGGRSYHGGSIGSGGGINKALEGEERAGVEANTKDIKEIGKRLRHSSAQALACDE